MNAFGTTAALTGVLAAGIVYGTDVPCALVQRPALTKLADVTVAAAMGRVHQYGDRRLPVPGIIGILAAAVTTVAWAVSAWTAGAIAVGIALIAMLGWLSLHLRVAAPINRALTAAAIAHVTPDNARSFQSRWDSIITTRALLIAVAVAGLAFSAAATSSSSWKSTLPPPRSSSPTTSTGPRRPPPTGSVPSPGGARSPAWAGPGSAANPAAWTDPPPSVRELYHFPRRAAIPARSDRRCRRARV